MRSCGVLMHISSLPSPYGIGTFGEEAEAFTDWLKSAGQKFWQVLPLGPTGFGNSPYQSFSTFAGNPLLIDLDDLAENGLITKEKCMEADFGADPTFVDFEKVYRTKMEHLHDAFANFSEDVAYVAFVNDNSDWLDDYALFMSIKEQFDQCSWIHWDDDIKFRKPEAMKRYRDNLHETIAFWKFVQYTFYAQWGKLKRYANRNDIQLIGDIPIYVAPDSADVWANPSLYMLDDKLAPTKVAGVPPDYFSTTGQLWGNPIYNWEKMKNDNYAWWVKRIKKASEMYDYVRIDHFRAFDTYYTVPAGETTAVNGQWEKGPGMNLFNAVANELGPVNIIAEDLGDIFDSVRELLKETGFPGMRVLQFGFNPDNTDNDHLPHRYPPNCVAYTGTHDNATIRQWYKEADRRTRAMATNYLGLNPLKGYNWCFIRNLYESSAGLVIVPMQDILGLGEKGRMNVPSTIGNNWIWRMTKRGLNEHNAQKLKKLTDIYFR